ncbi:MAG: hypothetical protein AB8G22_05720, partial [Saprospiraceae bacterium]
EVIMILANILIGGGFGALMLWYLQYKFGNGWKKGTAQGLVAAAVIYVLFALRMPEWKWILIEMGGVVLYSTFAILALRVALYWLGIGWLLHVLWDTLLHANGYPGYVPIWYTHFCLGFDIVVVFF